MALKTSLVSYWNLDESSGTRNDSHSTNHLTDVNTVGSTSDGLMGTVATFVSANSERLTRTDASQTGLDITGDLTMNIWVKFASTASASHTMMSKWYHSSQNQYFLAWNPSSKVGSVATDNNCSGFTYGIYNPTYTGSFNTTDWFMFTGIRTGTTATAYINGSLVGTSGTVQTSVNCTATFAIGCEEGRNVNFLNGSATRAGIWSRAISSTEVTELYNSGSGMTYAQLDAPVATFSPKVIIY